MNTCHRLFKRLNHQEKMKVLHTVVERFGYTKDEKKQEKKTYIYMPSFVQDMTGKWEIRKDIYQYWNKTPKVSKVTLTKVGHREGGNRK